MSFIRLRCLKEPKCPASTRQRFISLSGHTASSPRWLLWICEVQGQLIVALCLGVAFLFMVQDCLPPCLSAAGKGRAYLFLLRVKPRSVGSLLFIAHRPECMSLTSPCSGEAGKCSLSLMKEVEKWALERA